MRQHDDFRKYSFRKIWQYSLRKKLYLRLPQTTSFQEKIFLRQQKDFWQYSLHCNEWPWNIGAVFLKQRSLPLLACNFICSCWPDSPTATMRAFLYQQQWFCHTMLTTILPAATVPALYHTITTATGLYSKKLLFILHLYFLLTTVWGWKYLFFPFKSIRKGPIWMVIAKYRNCVFSKGMELIDTICAWHGIRAANKSICTQFQSHPSFSCKILIGGNAKDFPLQEEIKICKLIESLFLF